MSAQGNKFVADFLSKISNKTLLVWITKSNGALASRPLDIKDVPLIEAVLAVAYFFTHWESPLMQELIGIKTLQATVLLLMKFQKLLVDFQIYLERHHK